MPRWWWADGPRATGYREDRATPGGRRRREVVRPGYSAAVPALRPAGARAPGDAGRSVAGHRAGTEGATAAAPVHHGPALLRAMRPRQWTKNLLVLAPLLPAGAAVDARALAGAGVAFVVFCVVASGIYLLNDVHDVEADRVHPVKCHRPLADGSVRLRTGLGTGVVLLVVGAAGAAAWTLDLLLVVVAYVVIQVAYCRGLKHEPVLELACVASGFLLRALAGGAAAGVELSAWFLLTAGFGSLFVAAGKRYGEAVLGEREGVPVRRVVRRYTSSYLRFVWASAATVVVGTYASWSYEVGGGPQGSPWAVVSVAPVVLGVLRYAAVVDAGEAEEPEEVVLHDRVLLGLGVAWAATLALAVHA